MDREGGAGFIGSRFVAGGNETENVALSRQILGLRRKREALVRPVRDRPGHDRRYALDSGTVRALGWMPSHPFPEALAETVE